MECNVAIPSETTWINAVEFGSVEMLKFVFMCTGFVTWKEFHVHFLLAKGYKQNETLQHVEDYESLSIEPEGQHVCGRLSARCILLYAPLS